MATILFVMANPFCTEWDAEADKELYHMRTAIRESKYRSRIKLVEAVAAEFSELPSLLAEHKPDILHIAVPALADYGLFFQELERHSSPPTVAAAVSHRLAPSASASPAGDALVDILRAHVPSGNLKAVIMNTPFSERAASVLSQYAGTVIGTSGDTNDGMGFANVHQDACIAFARAFFQQLGAGAGIQESFLAGRRCVREILPSLPFGRADYYMIRDAYRTPPDVRLSEELAINSVPRPPIRAMFWAAVGTQQRFRAALNLGREVREIQRKILRGPYRDSWSLVVEWAVRRSEAQEHLLDNDPAVLIVSGHADRDGILLYCDDGRLVEMSSDELCGLLEIAGRGVRCVILNGCNTIELAQAAAEISGFAVGMDGRVPDAAAMTFAEGFFMALTRNKSLVDAVEIGKRAICGDGTLRDIVSSPGGLDMPSGGRRNLQAIPKAFTSQSFASAAERPFGEMFGVGE